MCFCLVFPVHIESKKPKYRLKTKQKTVENVPNFKKLQDEFWEAVYQFCNKEHFCLETKSNYKNKKLMMNFLT